MRCVKEGGARSCVWVFGLYHGHMQRIFLPFSFVGFGLSAAPGPLSTAQALQAFQMEKFKGE